MAESQGQCQAASRFGAEAQRVVDAVGGLEDTVARVNEVFAPVLAPEAPTEVTPSLTSGGATTAPQGPSEFGEFISNAEGRIRSVIKRLQGMCERSAV